MVIFVSRTSSVRRRLLAVAGVVTVAAGVLTTGAPASAKPATPEQVYVGIKVLETTSTDEKIELWFGATRTFGPSGEDTSVTVSVATKNGDESHVYNFPVPNSALIIRANGKDKLTIPRKDEAPYGDTALTFTAEGKATKDRCSDDAYVEDQKVKVDGDLFFDPWPPPSHAWGDIGHKHGETTFKPAGYLESAFGQPYLDCIGSTPPDPCVNALDWNVSNPDHTINLNGGEDNLKGFIDATRMVELKKPKGATRTDQLDLKAPVPTLKQDNDGNATLTIHTAGKDESGVAKLTSTAPASPVTESCGTGKSETLLVWPNSNFREVKTTNIRGQLFGPITVPDGSIGTISSTTK
jgi:hypothetical protein